MTGKQQNVVVLNPVVEPEGVVAAMAPRPSTLNGKTVGLLANGKHNAPELMEQLVKELSEQYEFASIIALDKKDASRPASSHFIEELVAKCDLVITAIGD